MILNKIIKFPTTDSKKSFIFLTIFYYGIFFLPAILYAYFYCDDKILVYSIFVETHIYNKSLFQISFQSFKDFLNIGRFYGLYSLHYIIYYFFHDRLSYYIVKSIFNLISVICFAWLLRLITKNNNNFKTYIFLIPILFLIPISVDPILSQGLSCQYSAIFVALASGFYILWHENKNKKYLYLAYIFFICSFFYYEIGLCIVPIFIIIAVRYRIKNQENQKISVNFKEYFLLSIKVCFKELKYFLIIFFIWILIGIYLQITIDINKYDGITFNFDFKKFILSWIVQIVQSLPFGMMSFNANLYNYFPEIKDIFLASFLSIFSYFIFLKLLPKINLKNNYRDVILIGLVLILVPSGLISFSIKYQSWALSEYFPSAFVQIFLQYFGVGFLLIAYVSHVLNNSRLYVSIKRQKLFINFIAIICSVSIGFVNILNYNIIHKKNIIEYQNQIKLFVKAINNKVLEDFPVDKKVDERLDKLSKSSILFFEFFVNNADKKIPKLQEKYKNLNVFYSFVPIIFKSYFLSYQKNFNALIIQDFFDKNNIEIFKKNIKLENFYYADSWLFNSNIINNNNFQKKNLSGFIIAGKLDMIGYSCNNSNQNCHRILSVLSPKIFIDKEYLFKLKNIIETLNNAFGENIFKDSFEQIEDKLRKSEDGILIKLENRIYKIERP